MAAFADYASVQIHPYTRSAVEKLAAVEAHTDLAAADLVDRSLTGIDFLAVVEEP